MNINTLSKPFIKWAGGKSQLIGQLKYPIELKKGLIKNYYEPFLGGGAVFFDIINHYPVKNFYLSDINEELILVYKVIQKDVSTLIDLLQTYQQKYLRLDQAKRKAYFYEIRDKYNNKPIDGINRATQMIFLNKTCFNGLFRLNKKGGFNVPFGDYKNPKILDESNLINVSKSLQKVELKVADFRELEKVVTTEDSFVYFDPPYRPLSKTSSFTSYSKTSFDEQAQISLANTFKVLNDRGAKLMLSNSDPKNIDQKDDFFETQYAGFNIQRVSANRMINSVATKRGKITELIITNYPTSNEQ
jgi:DNA adenine methylase